MKQKPVSTRCLRNVVAIQYNTLQDDIYLDGRGCNVHCHMLAGFCAASCNGHISACRGQAAGGLDTKTGRAACSEGLSG